MIIVQRESEANKIEIADYLKTKMIRRDNCLFFQKKIWELHLDYNLYG